MEEAFSNPNQSQERKIMFTHLPSMCTIKIFTVSGVLVDVINVNNGYDDGIAYWDLLSNEGLQVAAGMYIYHVQSKITEKSKLVSLQLSSEEIIFKYYFSFIFIFN